MSEKYNIKSYLSTIGKYGKLLTIDEEKELFEKMRNGDIETKMKARDELINRNLRLVVGIAKRYNTFDLRFEDLIAEGSNGLIIAIDKFDYTKGVRLSTYATPWITNRIMKSFEKNGTFIRLPKEKLELRLKLIKTEKELIQETGIKPTIRAIAEHLGLKVDISELNYIYALNTATLSLNGVVKASGGNELGELIDIVENTSEETPDKFARNQEIIWKINEIMSKYLSKRDMFVFRELNGLSENSSIIGRSKSKKELAESMGLSIQRIRQISTKINNEIKEHAHKELSNI